MLIDHLDRDSTVIKNNAYVRKKNWVNIFFQKTFLHGLYSELSCFLEGESCNNESNFPFLLDGTSRLKLYID